MIFQIEEKKKTFDFLGSSIIKLTSQITNISIAPSYLVINYNNNEFIFENPPRILFEDSNEVSVNQYSNTLNDKSLSSIPTYPFIEFNMGTNSILTFNNLTNTGSNNGIYPFSLDSKDGECNLVLTANAPIEYLPGSQVKIGINTAKFVEFSKILSANLSISTSTDGNIKSIEIGENGITIISDNNISIDIPLPTNINYSLSVLNENKDIPLNISLKIENNIVPNNLPNISIVLAEKSKTFIDQSFENYIGNSTIEIKVPPSTNVEVKSNTNNLPTGIIIKDDKGTTYQPNSLYIKDETIKPLDNTNTVLVIIILTLLVIVIVLAYLEFQKNEEDQEESVEDMKDDSLEEKKEVKQIEEIEKVEL